MAGPNTIRRTVASQHSSSNVARVIDPAGGSWYVERLTEDLAQAAWVRFTEIERAGGMAQCLEDEFGDPGFDGRQDLIDRIVGVPTETVLAELIG